MRQLEMKCAPGGPRCAPQGGVTIDVYRPEDRAALKAALIPLTEHCFDDQELDNVILKNPRVREDAVFVARLDGEVVGTTTACLDEASGVGEVHMVSVLPAAKGRRIGLALCSHAVEYLLNRDGLSLIRLTTDDHRLPAISVYLRLGFLPVVDDDEMSTRWSAVASQLGIRSLRGFSSLNAPAPDVPIG